MTGSDSDSLFDAIQRSEEGAMARLVEVVYDELRTLAHREMAKERVGHILQTTALVNEAYLRLFSDEARKPPNRKYFFAAAAKAMRRVLVDYARARDAKKRGKDFLRVTFDDGIPAPSTDAVALHEALSQLEAEQPRMGRVVELRHLVGLSVEETADQLGVSKRTVNDDWRYARAWLKRAMAAGGSEEAGDAGGR